jgi:hypothetical protein
MKTHALLLFALVSISPCVLHGQESSATLLQACPTLAPNDPALPSIQGLTPSNTSVRFNIQFVQMYGKTPTESWTREEQDNICKAAAYVQAVWSSKEFETAVEAKNDWKQRRAKSKLWLGFYYKTGPELYKDLVGTQPIVMRLSISANRGLVSDYAVTLPAGWTVFQRAYLDQPQNFECLKHGGSLVACLANTISHEYTHYSISAYSGDGTGGAVNDDNYISYGVGDLTQSLAFPKK